jgi:copper chaperone
MLKPLRLSSIIVVTSIFTFVLSFSVLQACVILPGKSCSSEPCTDEACPIKEAKAMLIKVSTAESVKTDEVVLNIKGMTCAGCEGRVKAALSSFEGVSDVKVNHKEGKAHLHVEEGIVDKAVLIEAVKQIGFAATEG